MIVAISAKPQIEAVKNPDWEEHGTSQQESPHQMREAIEDVGQPSNPTGDSD